LSGGLPNRSYKAVWFNPRMGGWIDAGVLAADSAGQIALPNFPDNKMTSQADWGLKLKLVGR